MNKSLRYFSIILFSAVVLVSCTKNTPKDVANEWLNDFFHLDYDAAKKLSTEDTKKLLSQVEQLASMVPDSTRRAYKNITITIKSVKVNGDNATVSYIGSDNPALEQPLNLIKMDGKWKVIYTKEDQPAESSADILSATPPTDSAAVAPADTAAVLETEKGK